MSNLCNQTSTLSNTAEIAENESRGSLTPSQWSSLTPTLILCSHSAGVSKISKV